MNRIVGAHELSDSEVRSLAQAVDVFRALPTSPSFFTSAPIRDDAGRLCEVRFYKDNEGEQPLAVIGIDDDGAVPPVSLLD